MNDICDKSLTEIKSALQEKRVGATEVVRACLERIEKTEPKIRALLHVDAENSLALAAQADKQGPDKDKSLWGIPVILKDAIATRGVPTTCASRILEGFVPFYDSFVARKLKDAGAIIIAKANMDEFAMGSSTENSAFQVTGNPWNTEHVPGGSSGGSAACVAAGQCFGALGTDTGGSIRLPASFCGLVGVKPTYGRVSRFGLIAYGSSLDQIGPLARNTADAAEILKVIAGHDRNDSTSVDTPVPDYLEMLARRKDMKGLTIGLPEEYWGEGLSSETAKACLDAVKIAESAGAKTVKVKLPLTSYSIAVYYVIAMAEASSNLARFDGVRYGFRNKDASELIDMYVSSRSTGFGDEVQRRIMLGTYVLSAGYYDAYYRKAAQVRRLLRRDFEKAFTRCDLILGPVCPTTAFRIGEKTSDPLQMYLMDIFTIALNLIGFPGMSLPVGIGSDSKMPVGLQIIAPPFEEGRMLQAAAVIERELGPMPTPVI